MDPETLAELTQENPIPSTQVPLDWALYYARKGWFVLPVRPRQKTPLTENGLLDASADEAVIGEWWGRWPAANIGIRTGSESNLLVLDVDAKSGGLDALEDLLREHGPFPETPESHTGGGGRHHLFSYPGGHIGNSVGKIGPGLDIRGEGGYIVAPPSIHESGVSYEWEVSSSPDLIPVAPAPEWLIERIRSIAGHPNGRVGAPGEPIVVGSRNDALFRIGSSLRGRFGCGQEEIERFLLDINAGRCVDEQGNPAPMAEWEVRAIAQSIAGRYPIGPTILPIRSNRGRPAGSQAKAEGGRGKDRLPVIRLRGGDLPAHVDAAEAALLALPGCDIYQRGGILVRPIRLESMSLGNGVRRHAESLTIHEVDAPHLTERMTQAADWRRYEKGSNRWKTVDCPQTIALTYMARVGSWRAPALLGIVEAPTLRPDGSILAVPGYDQATGLLFDPGSVRFPPIQDQPGRDDAEAALSLVLDVLRGFPFVAESDRSTAVSAILSGLIRKSIKTAPLHAFRAPKMRSGKTLLADCVSLFASGRPCAVMSQGVDQGEERKRLLAVLLEGDPVVCFDNIDRPFGGAAISQALTQERIKDRILGETRIVTVPCTALFLATGNNLVFQGDITSRVLLCDIDPECERPEERKFERNLYDYIPTHRDRLVCAALTILRAYHVAGRPVRDLPRWGGFEEWSDWVRGALVWLGMDDPARGRQRLEDTDPDRCNLRSLLTAWSEFFDTEWKTSGDVVKASEDAGKEQLRAALEETASNRRGEINSRSLGKFLSANEKRIEGGLRFERGGTHQGAVLWRVVPIEEP